MTPLGRAGRADQEEGGGDGGGKRGGWCGGEVGSAATERQLGRPCGAAPTALAADRLAAGSRNQAGGQGVWGDVGHRRAWGPSAGVGRAKERRRAG